MLTNSQCCWRMKYHALSIQECINVFSNADSSKQYKFLCKTFQISLGSKKSKKYVYGLLQKEKAFYTLSCDKLWSHYYFGGARSKGFATLRNVSKFPFFDKIGHAKSVGFRFYSAIWRSESRISSRYLEITSISLIYSLTFSRKKEILFWLPRGLNRLTCVTCQVRGDSKLRD